MAIDDKKITNKPHFVGTFTPVQGLFRGRQKAVVRRVTFVTRHHAGRSRSKAAMSLTPPGSLRLPLSPCECSREFRCPGTRCLPRAIPESARHALAVPARA